MTPRSPLVWSVGAAGPVLRVAGFGQTSDEEQDWRDFAACAGTDDPDGLFFPEVPGRVPAKGKVLCRSCPARADCLAYTLKHRIDSGVWGGLSEDERRELRGLKPRQAA